nr:integrase [Vibrio cholerae]
NFSHLTHKMFNRRPDVVEGKLVIPPRIYFSALTGYSEDVVHAYGLRDEIEQAVERMISYYDDEVINRTLKIRNGCSYSPIKSYRKTWERFTHALGNEGVALADKGEDPRWMKIFISL